MKFNRKMIPPIGYIIGSAMMILGLPTAAAATVFLLASAYGLYRLAKE